MVVHSCNPSYKRGSQSQVKSVKPNPKTNKVKKTACVSQVVEHFPSNDKVLDSNNNTTHKQINKQIIEATEGKAR
jgi:hypothetical protein